MPLPTVYTCKSKIRKQKGVRPSIITTETCPFYSYDRGEAQAHVDATGHEVWGSPNGERIEPRA